MGEWRKDNSLIEQVPHPTVWENGHKARKKGERKRETSKGSGGGVRREADSKGKKTK